MITYERLRELQQFAELGRVSASLLHEISNPLSAALLNLELSDNKSANVRRGRRDIQLIRRYVEAARQQVCCQSRMTEFWIRPQLEELKRVFMPLASQAGVQLRIDPLPACQLYGDPVKFQHIISNLLSNAIQAYARRPGQRPAVQLSLVCRSGWLTVRVTDWGQGISDEDLPHIFEAFYTTKAPSVHGLGIGLAIVKRYVESDFGGTITAVSSRADGTRFTVKPPLPNANRD